MLENQEYVGRMFYVTRLYDFKGDYLRLLMMIIDNDGLDNDDNGLDNDDDLDTDLETDDKKDA